MKRKELLKEAPAFYRPTEIIKIFVEKYGYNGCSELDTSILAQKFLSTRGGDAVWVKIPTEVLEYEEPTIYLGKDTTEQ